VMQQKREEYKERKNKRIFRKSPGGLEARKKGAPPPPPPVFAKSRVHKSWAPGHHGNKIIYHGTRCLWILSTELTLWYLFVAKNFEDTVQFLETLCTAEES